MPQLTDYPHLASWLTPRDEGQERVLDAFEEAVVSFGVHGASFAKIAEVGGFHRSLVQHHFGSRAQLHHAALERVVDLYSARVKLIQSEPNPLTKLLDWLFSPFGDGGPPRIATVVDAFVAVANTDESARAYLESLYSTFARAIRDGLLQTYPGIDEAKAFDAAYLIVCLSFGRAGLETLRVGGAGPTAARVACDTLIAALLDT